MVLLNSAVGSILVTNSSNSSTVVYKDAGVEYVQIWAALDERMCKTCESYHEKIYPIDYVRQFLFMRTADVRFCRLQMKR